MIKVSINNPAVAVVVASGVFNFLYLNESKNREINIIVVHSNSSKLSRRAKLGSGSNTILVDSSFSTTGSLIK